MKIRIYAAPAVKGFQVYALYMPIDHLLHYKIKWSTSETIT